MSVRICGAVWDAKLPRDEKFLLLCYADHADHYGESIYPAKTTVERMTGYSRRSVQTITAKLVAMGILVERGTSTWNTTTYAIDLDKLEQLRGAQILRGAQKTTEGGRKKQHERGANSAPNPLRKPSMDPESVLPEADLFSEAAALPVEHPEIPPELRTPELLEAWGKWKLHRKQLRKPLTPVAISQQVSDMREWGANAAVASINSSLGHGYQGLFKPKGLPPRTGPITPENALRPAPKKKA